MKLKENECRIYYSLKGKSKFLPFEKELTELFENNGFERWASGFDMCNGIRDLCFERSDINAPQKR